MTCREPIRRKVIVVGAGYGGLAIAVALGKAQEEDFLILEKQSGVGGVWRNIQYPGCACSVPTDAFAVCAGRNESRAMRYPSQREALSHLQTIAATDGINKKIKFKTEIREARFDQRSAFWDLFAVSNGDRTEHYRAEVVVFATGHFGEPSYPHDLYLKDFEGKIVHSAKWDNSVSLHNKRVAIVGSGLSAVQMLPAIAEVAAEVSIYQRTPQWILPKPDSELTCFDSLLKRLPRVRRAYSRALNHVMEMSISSLSRRRGWHSLVECCAKQNTKRHFSESEIENLNLAPDYPIGIRRIIFDDRFYATVKRRHVKLVAEPIKRICRRTIYAKAASMNGKPAGGAMSKTEVDIIILATGFRPPAFLRSISVLGRDGHKLVQDWQGKPEAFLGIAIWRYPNLFLIGGPQSHDPAGNSLKMIDVQVTSIIRCLRLRDSTKTATIEVKQEANLEHQLWLHRQLERTIWPRYAARFPNVQTGHIANVWPLSLNAYKRRLKRNLASFELSGCEEGATTRDLEATQG